ncbi:hypothetical protein PoB_007123700 [Plakobranchus ocellatus]|uniref:Uncharacterized protein n=1 Tax=Plakobranchus ocellatus TaxID=259542 RepID=A0AAV4DKC2_9GAST|nr:hypothetical protein PoB_007123700 [Plakobranchus ocellatus]
MECFPALSFEDLFHKSVGVRQECLLSTLLFKMLLERFITDALNHERIMRTPGSIEERKNHNPRFENAMSRSARQELERLMKRKKYSIETGA